MIQVTLGTKIFYPIVYRYISPGARQPYSEYVNYAIIGTPGS